MKNQNKLNATKEEVVQPQKVSQAFKKFDTEEEWQTEIDRIIGNRLKKRRTEENVTQKYYKLSKLVNYYFGSDDINVLHTIFSNLKRATMAKQLYQEANDNSLKSGFDKKISQIEKRADEYSTKNSDFSLEQALEKPEFLKYLWDLGLDIEDADLLLNRDSIKKNALLKAEETIVSSILAKNDIIRENGVLSGQSAIRGKRNPSSFTSKDIDDILSRVKKGEKISF